MKSDIKVVLFDVSGVLFEANKVVGGDIEASFGVTQEQQMPMWKGVYREFSAGKLAPDEFLDEVAQILKLDRSLVTEDLFTRSFIKALAPVLGMAELLDELAENHAIEMAILSDTTPFHHKIRSGEGYYSHFEKIFLSFEIGYCKPAKEAYQTVIDYYKVQPEQIFFIDDNPSNVAAARELGIQAEIFTTAENLEKQLVKLGVL